MRLFTVSSSLYWSWLITKSLVGMQLEELAFKQQEHQMDLQYQATANQQKVAQDQAKFDQQVAQDSAKAMMDLNNKAREDKEKADE